MFGGWLTQLGHPLLLPANRRHVDKVQGIRNVPTMFFSTHLLLWQVFLLSRLYW